MAAGVVVGAVLGWGVSSYFEKQRSLEENTSLWTRLREFEQRLYHDGYQKSLEIEEIRQKVENKISEEA